MADEPIAPEVFDFLDDFLEKASIRAVAGASALDPESNVLAFCENFFAQFFQNELGEDITSFSSVSAQRAGVLRRSLPGDDRRRRLIRDFQHLCKVHPDLLGDSYGSGGDERAEFFYYLGIDAGDEKAEAQLLAKLETHRFGMNRSLGKLTWQNLVSAGPRVVFRGIYPILALTSCALVVLYAVT